MTIHFIIATRNNLKYLEWSYYSIREFQGSHEVKLRIADDASSDETALWLKTKMRSDSNMKCFVNRSEKRYGLTYLYDELQKGLLEEDLILFWHSDMYLTPNALDALEEIMYTDGQPNYKTIGSLTRIEPPLHPAGPEKIIFDAGLEPENFQKEKLLSFIESYQFDHETTNGVFAPWACFVKDYREILGHDHLFRPQSKEDSDIWNTFLLNRCKFIQTWKGFVYHLTSRGSRFNPMLTTVGVDSEEWKKQNKKALLNFVRKWHTYPLHSDTLEPIVKQTFPITFWCSFTLTYGLIELLEPWCTYLAMPETEENKKIREYFISQEQDERLKELFERKIVFWNRIDPFVVNVNFVVEIPKTLTQEDYNIIEHLTEGVSNLKNFAAYTIGGLRIGVGMFQKNTYAGMLQNVLVNKIKTQEDIEEL